MQTTPPSIIDNFFTDEQITYLSSLPETITANEQLLKTAPTASPSYLSSVHFTITLTPDIQQTIAEKFGINLDITTQIPMKWIIGNIPAHFDTGTQEFANTYLVYLNDSGGNLIIDDISYPITKNRAFKFQEGLPHYTDNVYNTPRLLIGPMDELGNRVGIPTQTLFYIDVDNNQIAVNNLESYVVGDLDPTTIALGYNQNYTTWFIDDTNANESLTLSSLNRFYTNGDVLIGNIVDNFVMYLMKAVIFSIYYYPTYTDAQNQTNLLGFNCSRSTPYYTVGTLDASFADYRGLRAYMTNWKIYQQTGTDGSVGGDTVYRNGDVLNGILDSGFSNTYILYNIDPAPQPMSMKSLFTDNSRVYYKRGSLASGGVGTVKNSRSKAKHT